MQHSAVQHRTHRAERCTAGSWRAQVVQHVTCGVVRHITHTALQRSMVERSTTRTLQCGTTFTKQCNTTHTVSPPLLPPFFP